MKKNILSMAALLIASATVFTACSNDDSIINEPQPAQGTKTYTMTINASKGGDATTRALSLGRNDADTKNVLNATWDENEVVLVYQGGSQIGTLYSAASTTNETTLTGTLDSAPDAAQDLTLYFHTNATPSYAGQDGTLATIASTYDFCAPATITPENFTVSGNTVSTTGSVSFGANQQAIVKFTLKDKGNSDAAISATKLVISDGTNTYTVNPSSATSVIYAAIPGFTGQTVKLTATVGDDTYTFEKTGVTFTNGQYYEITVKMTKYVPTLADVFTDGAVVSVKVNTEGGYWYGVTGTYNAGSRTYTTDGSGTLTPSSVSMIKDGDNLVASVTDYNTYTVTFNTTDNTYTESATSNSSVWCMTTLNSITINGTDITSTLTNATPVATTKTWNFSEIGDRAYLDRDPFTLHGIVLSCADGGEIDFDRGSLNANGNITFSNTLGKNFKSIVIYSSEMVDISDFDFQQWEGKATWTGNASSITFSGKYGGAPVAEGITSIVFTLE